MDSFVQVFQRITKRADEKRNQAFSFPWFLSLFSPQVRSEFFHELEERTRPACWSVLSTSGEETMNSAN